MQRKIYAIRDNVTNDLAGPLMLFKHEAAALRTWADIAKEGTTVAHHVRDHDLICVGEIDDATLQIINTEIEVVMTGARWYDLQQNANNQQRTLELENGQ